MNASLTLIAAMLALATAGCSSSRGYEQNNLATSSLPPRPTEPMLREPARPYGNGYGLGSGYERAQPGEYRWNGNHNRIQEGAAPANPAPPPAAVTANGQRMIVVRSGDTLYSLARHYGVSVAALAEENRLMTASIQVGQRLVLPAAAR